MRRNVNVSWKSALLGAALICACSGTSAHTPDQSVPQTDDSDSQAATSHEIDAGVAITPVAPVVDAAPVQTIVTAPPDAAPPDAAPAKPRRRGWHCHELRRKRGDEDYLSHCFRSMSECNNSRAFGVKKGGVVTKCVAGAQAFCFLIASEVEEYRFYACSESVEQCNKVLFMWEKRDHETISGCKLRD